MTRPYVITILVADDDPGDRESTRAAMTAARLAYDLRFVEDGEELMEYLQHRGRYADPADAPRPGLILLDLNMPRKDGREALEEIKRDPDLRRIPVVVLTRSKADEDIVKSYDLGVNSYIRKPMTHDGLVRIMRVMGTYWFEIVELPELREAQEQLRRQGQLLDASQEMAHMGSWEWDVTEDRITWSRELYRMYGVDPDVPLTYARFLETVHPDDRQVVDEAVQQAYRTGEAWSYDHRIVQPDGTVRFMYSRGQVDTDPQGQVTRLWGTSQDVTIQKEAQRALEEAHQSVRAVIDYSPLAIMAIDPDGLVTLWNPAAEQLFGWTADTVLGQPLPIIPEARADEHRQLRERIMRGERIEGAEFTRRTKDGREVVIRLHVGPIGDAHGQIRGMVGVLQDVTHVHELEAQARQSQKMESIGRLSGGIAHDFNNILTAILGNTEFLMLDMEPGDPRLADVEAIGVAARRAADLTSQLLAFSRKQVLVPQIVNVNALVAESERLLQRILGEDVELRTTLDPALAAVEADPAQLQQVVMNLAVNARDAMPTGGELTINTCNVELDRAYSEKHVEAKPGHYVRLSVSDTGTGIDADTRPRLFEPFFTTKEQGKGTGLGLSTVDGIVAQSGGHISVSTELGRGSTFNVYLPRAQGVAPPMAARESGELPGGTETILLVEDELGVRHLARRILERQGYTVLVAEGPAEARRVLSDHQPDGAALLISDVVMPGESGPRLAKDLKAVQPGLKVLLISGYAGEAVAHHGLRGGRVPFLPKPFTPEELSRKVREVLDGVPPGERI